MLNATSELIDGIRRQRPGAHAARVLTAARTAVVSRHGGPEDAHALLDLFLEAPTEYKRSVVLGAVMRAGDVETARRLASACLPGGRLKEGVEAAVLHALGFLGFAEARDVLWRHARDGDYYVQQAATLGLLNLSCDGLEPEIEAAIRGCVGKNLFAEFLPTLACKTGNPELLQTILDLGRTTASTDCNGGIVYGVALFGEAGRAYFEQLLFDPHWEADGSGTGTRQWAYHGFRHLGGSLVRLAAAVRAGYGTLPQEANEHRTQIWLALAECWLGDPRPPIRGEEYPCEAAADVCAAAFDWSSENGDDSLTRDGRADGAYAIRERLDDRIAVEVFRESPRVGG